MADFNITSVNAVVVAQFMMSFDITAIDEQFRADSTIWLFNVKHALKYHLKLTHGDIVLPANRLFKEEFSESILALSKYTNNLFEILSPQAKENLIHNFITS